MPCCSKSCFVPGDIWCLPMFAGALHTDEDDGDGRRGHDGAQVSVRTSIIASCQAGFMCAVDTKALNNFCAPLPLAGRAAHASGWPPWRCGRLWQGRQVSCGCGMGCARLLFE